MKTLIVSSNLSSQFRSILPFGAACLSAYLKQNQMDVKVAHVEKKSDFKKLKTLLSVYQPDVVGISATISEARHIPTFAALAKDWNRSVPVVVGGIHATLVPEEVLSLDTVDCVCRGEGEEAFVEFLRSVESGEVDTTLRNFWFKRDGVVIKNESRPFIENLDTLPYMDRRAIDYQKTIRLNHSTVTTVIGKGCTDDCYFCCNRVLRSVGTGRWVRNRSVDNVLGDIEQLSRDYGFNYLHFRDDNFSWNRAWLMEFCEKYPKRFDYEFDCFSRCDTLDKESMKALYEAGCRNIFMGLDSGDDYIRNEVLNKQQTNETFVEVCEYLNALGIKVCVSNIVGLPYETPERFQETIKINRIIHRNQVVFSRAFGAAPKIWVFNPFPGTVLHDLCKKEGWLTEMPSEYKVYRESYIDMPQFSRKEIDKWFRNFRYVVYKDSHPFFAWLFRFYDSRLGVFLMERLPAYWYGQGQYLFSKLSRMLKPKKQPKPTQAIKQPHTDLAA